MDVLIEYQDASVVDADEFKDYSNANLDAETLSMALGWAMTMEPDKRAELENNAMLHAFKTYKRDETARQIFDIYDELLA